MMSPEANFSGATLVIHGPKAFFSCHHIWQGYYRCQQKVWCFCKSLASNCLRCAKRSIVHRVWLFWDPLVVRQRFTGCCDRWFQNSDSSFKSIWILPQWRSCRWRLEWCSISLRHCWAHLCSHPQYWQSTYTGLAVWSRLCWYMDVLPAWSAGFVLAETHLGANQRCVCCRQHCGKYGWWGRSLARIFSKYW